MNRAPFTAESRSRDPTAAFVCRELEAWLRPLLVRGEVDGVRVARDAECEALWQYFKAAADGAPDAAGSALESLLVTSPDERHSTFGRSLRQQPPARGLGPSYLQDSFFYHERVLKSLGLEPKPVLAIFYERLHEAADDLEAFEGRDLLREVFEALWLRYTIGTLFERADGQRLGEDLRHLAALWMDLPQKLDAALTKGQARVPSNSLPKAPTRPEENPSASLALLLATVTLAILFYFAPQVLPASWGEPLGATLLLMVGGAFLMGLGGQS